MEIDSLPSDKARTQWSTLLDHVWRDGEHITITRHGKPVAVMVSPEWYEETKDRIEAWEAR